MISFAINFNNTVDIQHYMQQPPYMPPPPALHGVPYQQQFHMQSPAWQPLACQPPASQVFLQGATPVSSFYHPVQDIPPPLSCNKPPPSTYSTLPTSRSNPTNMHAMNGEMLHNRGRSSYGPVSTSSRNDMSYYGQHRSKRSYSRSRSPPPMAKRAR